MRGSGHLSSGISSRKRPAVVVICSFANSNDSTLLSAKSRAETCGAAGTTKSF